MTLFESQPAYLMYAFDGGWKVMNFVFSNIFVRTNAAARTWFNWSDEWKLKASSEQRNLYKYWKWCMVAGFYVAGLSQYLAAMLFVAIFVVIQFLLLVAWAFISTLIILCLTLFNFLYGNYYKIFVRCPSCYEQMRIPVFVCPVCATEHTRLWPSVYGVFHHRCASCNTKLATFDVLGRNELTRKCVACSRPMNRKVGTLVNVHVPVIGGPSAGKSNYIFMATRELIETYALPRSYEVEFPDERDQEEYTRNLQSLSSGRACAKTPDITPQAYNLALKRPGDRIGRIIYLYDAAGEAYATEDNTILQTYYDYVDGLVFVIDPFSIDIYRREHEEEVDALKGSLRPSALSVMEAYERMIAVLESSVGLTRGKKFQHPIAVIVTKTDALDLEDRIGRSAANELMMSDPSIRLESDAIHELVKQFLVCNEQDNLVRDLTLQFENVRFFSCSALGRMPDASDRSPFEPMGVLEPLLWVLGTLKVINSTKERARFIDSEHHSMAKARGNVFASAKYYYWDSLKPRPQ